MGQRALTLADMLGLVPPQAPEPFPATRPYVPRERSQTRKTLGDFLMGGMDVFMGALGLPGGPESKARVAGELLAAGMPVIGGVKALSRLDDAVAGIKAGSHSLNRPELIKAAEQGFDPTPMWHETHADNVPSLLQEGFDLTKGRARLSDEMMPDGVFLKPSGKGIGLTVNKEDAAQVPLVHRAQNTAVFNDRDQLKEFLLKDEQYRSLFDNVGVVDRSYIPKFDELEKVAYGKRSYENDPVSERAREELDRLLDEWKAANDAAATAARQRATQLFREKGHDSIRVARDAGSFGRSVDTTVILDPEKVRSIYAAFDPAKRSSKELLASLAAITGGAALADAQRRESRR